MKVIGYCRVSTEEQAKEGISLEAQEARIKSYCALYDLQLVHVCHDAASGKSLDREGLQEALAMLEQGEAEGLITAKLDRLTRSVRDLGTLLDDSFSRFSLFVVAEQIDTRTAAGRLVANLLGSVAQWERETIGERTKDALSAKRSKGEWTGRVPYGFKVNGKHLEQDPDQLKVIQRAKRMKREGKSIREIARCLELSRSVVHRHLNANTRTVKAKYANGSSKVSVP